MAQNKMNETRYRQENTMKYLLERLGSYDLIAARVAANTNLELHPSSNTIRRWFNTRVFPLRELLLMLRLARLDTRRVFEFHPYLIFFLAAKNRTDQNAAIAENPEHLFFIVDDSDVGLPLKQPSGVGYVIDPPYADGEDEGDRELIS